MEEVYELHNILLTQPIAQRVTMIERYYIPVQLPLLLWKVPTQLVMI